MNIAHIEEQSFIYGPGCRSVIWVQGCSIHCKGCWNKDMWGFNPKYIFTIPQLVEKIQREIPHIEGITLLGGEPLDQFQETFELLTACKKLNLTTMVFTGYEMNEIHEKNMSSLLEVCDILITGRYVEALRTTHHQWIGSTNQEIHFLTDRYKDYAIRNANYVEVSIDEMGKIQILGFPDEDILYKLSI